MVGDRASSLLSALRQAVGSNGVLTADAIEERYTRDRSVAPGVVPLAVCLPGDTAAVARLAALCNREGLPLTPRGAGTGKAGGCVPAAGGVVCSMERMTGVDRLSPHDQLVEVGAGTITGHVRDAVQERGWFYPPDPASLDECTLGGNIATNAGGPCCLKYGVTADYVLGLEVVLADGRVVRPGHRSIKGVAGLDLRGLMIGSEGTLGIVTRAILRIRPHPREVAAAWVAFRSSTAACDAAARVLACGLLPRAMELLDETALAAVGRGDGAALLIEFDGMEGYGDQQLGAALGKLAPAAAGVEVADTPDERNALWALRRTISDEIKKPYAYHLSEDVAVPVSRLADLVRAIRPIGERCGIALAAYGHAGDGNLHVNLLYDDVSQLPQVTEASESIFRATLDLGGTITGEHGIGLCKRPYLGWEQSDELLDVQRSLKRAMDPKGILNPGKILP